MNQAKIHEIDEQIKKLQLEKKKLIEQQENNILHNFIDNDYEIIDIFNYKRKTKEFKNLFRIKKTVLYDNFLEYIKENKIDMDYSKKTFKKILERLNIKLIVNTGIVYCLLKEKVKVEEFIECDMCKKDIPANMYESHFNNKTCKIFKKFNDLVNLQVDMD